MEPENSSRSSLPLPYLPIEIITEILLRLPVKSLLKFRCVCKSWFSLITSPSFINTSTQNNNTYKLLCRIEGSCASVYSCSIYPKIDENPCVDTVSFDSAWGKHWYFLRIVGSCNGLVCLAFYQDVSLWNPATREYRRLPHSGTDVAFVLYGFGYDATNDDYKVVEFNCTVGNDSEEFRVYSLRDDSWRILDWAEEISNISPGVFVNGALHWEVLSNGPGLNKIIALNVTTETCTIMDYPDLDHAELSAIHFGVSGGPLSVCFEYETCIDVWVMKEYGVAKSWTKLLRFPHYLDTWDFSGEPIMPVLVLESGGDLFGYKNGLVIFEPPHYYLIDRFFVREGVEATVYRESLVSPNSFVGVA